jgi:hypothetical protein
MIEIDTISIEELHKQLVKGKIQKGYKNILEYLLYLQAYLKKKYVKYDFPGTLYHGYLDMSYFAVIPPTLKEKRLKITIVFNYESFRFELWLSGYNKDIQKKYLDIFIEKKIKGYFIPDTVQGYDSILEDYIEIEKIDIKETTEEIEERMNTLIKTVEENI